MSSDNPGAGIQPKMPKLDPEAGKAGKKPGYGEAKSRDEAGSGWGRDGDVVVVVAATAWFFR